MAIYCHCSVWFTKAHILKKTTSSPTHRCVWWWWAVKTDPQTGRQQHRLLAASQRYTMSLLMGRCPVPMVSWAVTLASLKWSLMCCSWMKQSFWAWSLRGALCRHAVGVVSLLQAIDGADIDSVSFHSSHDTLPCLQLANSLFSLHCWQSDHTQCIQIMNATNVVKLIFIHITSMRCICILVFMTTVCDCQPQHLT